MIHALCRSFPAAAPRFQSPFSTYAIVRHKITVETTIETLTTSPHQLRNRTFALTEFKKIIPAQYELLKQAEKVKQANLAFIQRETEELKRMTQHEAEVKSFWSIY